MPSVAQGGQNRYFTEKNFSRGEILILNALFELNNATNKSLVLIDEVELALHPKVQVKCLHFLQNITQQKELTIIISTHSSSLIINLFIWKEFLMELLKLNMIIILL